MQWLRTGETPTKPIKRRVMGSVADRLATYTDRSAGPEACWPWTAGRTRFGYGMVASSRSQLAHRAAYEHEYGPIPPGMVIDHRCGNPACVNPAHLRACSQKQNMENLRGPHANNSTSGIRGVSWHAEAKKWVAQVTHHGKHLYVGVFENIEDAEAAVTAKRKEVFTHNDADRA